MKVLITGGAGFIGSHLVDRLVELKHEVFVIDDFSTGKKSNVNQRSHLLSLEAIDNPRDKQDITLDFLDKNKDIDLIFHLGATASVPKTIAETLYSNENNITLTLKILDWLKNNNKNCKLVFASSSAIYGNTNVFPTTEETPVNILNPYANQKYAAEQYCLLYSNLYGLKTVSLRFFNVYGPRQNGVGPYANVISSWLEKIKIGDVCLQYGDGTQTRDFVYVSDVVDCLNVVGFDKDISGVYNICSGHSITLNFISETFSKHFSERFKVKYLPDRMGDVKDTLGSNTKILSVMPEDYQFMAFRDGIEKTIKWYEGK